VPIRDLVGQTPDVVSMGADRRLVTAKSDLVWHVGKKPVYELRLASGRKLRATQKHRLYSSFGWQQVGDLRPGDRLAISRKLPEPCSPETLPDDRVALLAHLIGDGSYPKHQPMRYTTASEECSELVRRAAETEFGATVTRYPGRGNWHQLVISGNGNRWHPAGVNLWLRELGIYGQRSLEKRVPAAIFTLSNRQVALFLRHLWATDGTISPRKPGQRGCHGVHFSTCSRGLADDVAALLLRLGIVARIQTVTAGYRNPVHMVWVRGVDHQMLFLNTVGCFGPRVVPGERLLAALVDVKANTNVDTLPEEMLWRVRFLMQQQSVSRRQMSAMLGQKNVCFEHAPSRRLMAEYGRILGDRYLQEAAGSDIFWDRIVSVEPVGEEEVFDLTVPETSCWLLDGVVSHNSGAIEQDADMILLIYREEVYDRQTTRKGIAEIDLVKHRNGEIGTFTLTFQGQFTRFANYVPDSYADGVMR
jgi:replicative DNA helicase